MVGHSGQLKLRQVLIQLNLAGIKISDKQIPQLVEDGAKLDRYLFARHVPLEEKDIFYKKKEIEKGVLLKAGVRHVSELSKKTTIHLLLSCFQFSILFLFMANLQIRRI